MYQNRLCSVETTFKIYLLFGTVFSNLKTKVKTSRRNTTNYFLFPGSGHRLLSVFSGLQQEQNCWQVLANRFQLQFWFQMSMVDRVLDVHHPGPDESVFSTAQMLFTRPIHLSLSPGEERKKHKDKAKEKRKIDVMLTFSVTSWHLIFERHICSNLKGHSTDHGFETLRLWDSESTQVRPLDLSIFQFHWRHIS